MNLLIVSAYFDSHRGGVERVAGRLATEMAQRGLSVAWLAADASPPREITGVQSVPVPSNNWVQTKTGVPMPFWGIRGLVAMWKAVRSADAVMLHDTLYMGNIAAYMTAKFLRRPIVVVQHVGKIRFHNLVFNWLMSIGDRLVGRPMMAFAEQTVFISQRIANEFQNVAFKRTPEIVFNAVQSDIFDPTLLAGQKDSLRRDMGLPSDRHVVMFAGRFVPRKGLALLHLMAKTNPDVAFLFAGWGPIEPRDWGLGNVHVTVVDAPEEMARLYAVSDVLVLPSTGEGFPLVVQEALSMGLRVICSSETIAADAALETVASHAPFDADALDVGLSDWNEALESALEPEPSDACFKRSEFANANYGMKATIDRYLAILERVCPEPAR